jgi:hypothetical protein
LDDSGAALAVATTAARTRALSIVEGKWEEEAR